MPVMNAAACAELMAALTAVGVRAALVIRDAAGEHAIHRKADDSPVTEADLAAEAAICQGLARLAPALPIISEERAEHDRPIMGDGSYFLVDPLDGTREFISGRDEYTVNIAVMTNGVPVAGVIAAPALKLIWRGVIDRGAERIEFTGDGRLGPPRPVHTRPWPPRDSPQELAVLISRSHLDERTKAYLAQLPQARTIACGSALKFCRVAEGSADLYPRLGPTRDWDVAAGHAIVAAAGGSVQTPQGTAVRYGTADLRIPGFIASGCFDGAPIAASAAAGGEP